MPNNTPRLTTRSSHRRMIGFQAHIEVAPEHTDLVRLSTVGAARVTSAQDTAVDISEGGIGILSSLYLPRRCKTLIKLMDPINEGKVLFEAPARVARSIMVDKRPAYQLGMVYTDTSDSFTTSLARFLQLIDESS